jgi:choline dehydrogenase
VNTCIALRGQRADYDEWASLGLREWSWDECLPAFKRLERDLDVQGPLHGDRGPIAIRRHAERELSPWQRALMESSEALGFSRENDFNAGRCRGYGPMPMNKVAGVRQSVARGYLTPEVRARDNLRIQANTLVRRVLFEGRRAVGVEVERDGEVSRIDAKRVVLSAGAVLTPGILFRSGVGPRALLERLGVSLVHESPHVGARVLDHPGTAIFVVPKDLENAGFPLMQCMLRYSTRGGHFADDAQVQAGSFFWAPRFEFPIVSIMTTLQRPRGAMGRLEVSSADPHARPELHGNLLSDPWDRGALREGLELMHLLASTAPMRDHVAMFLHPRPSALRDKAKLDAYLEGACASGYHPCGTIPMSADDNAAAGAADSRGRVRGTEGLVVADASLFPTIPSANIHIPTVMLGERFGEWLRDEDPA